MNVTTPFRMVYSLNGSLGRKPYALGSIAALAIFVASVRHDLFIPPPPTDSPLDIALVLTSMTAVLALLSLTLRRCRFLGIPISFGAIVFSTAILFAPFLLLPPLVLLLTVMGRWWRLPPPNRAHSRPNNPSSQPPPKDRAQDQNKARIRCPYCERGVRINLAIQKALITCPRCEGKAAIEVLPEGYICVREVQRTRKGDAEWEPTAKARASEKCRRKPHEEANHREDQDAHNDHRDVGIKIDTAWCLDRLGVTHYASADEIRHAYRAKISQYHPDKVAQMGEKIQRVAKEESRELNKAYAYLKERGLSR